MGQDDQFVCLILSKHPAQRKLGPFPVHFARCIRARSMDALVVPPGFAGLPDRTRQHKYKQLEEGDF